MAKIGSLFVSLGLQSAAFTDGLKKARREKDEFAASALKMGKTVAGAFAAAAAGAVAMSAALAAPINRAISGMDELAKSAQKVGTSVGDLARLRFAGSIAGLDNQQLQVGLTRLNVALAGIGRESTAATQALARLGVEAGTSSFEAIKRIAAEFERIPDGVQKSALAVQIFGRSGAELIPLLNSGAEGIAKAAEEAARLGVIIDTKTAKAAESFKDDLNRLATASRGIITQISAGMVPALAAITRELLGNVSVGDEWRAFGVMLGKVIIDVGEAAVVAYEAITAATGALYAFLKAGARVRRLDFRGAIEEIQIQDFKTQEAVNKRRATFARLRADIAAFKPGDDLAAQSATVDEVAASVESIGVAAASSARQVETLADRLAAMGNLKPSDLFKTAAKYDGPLSEIDLAVMRTPLDDMIERLDQARSYGADIARNLSQAIVYGQGIGKALVQSFKAAAAEALASGLFKLLFGVTGTADGGLFGKAIGGGTGKATGLFGTIIGALGSVFGGARAEGGPVQSGKAYLVGERGPEIFAPAISGNIIPAGANGMTINVDARGAGDPAMVEAAVRRGVEVAINYTNGAFRSSQRPRLPRSMGAA